MYWIINDNIEFRPDSKKLISLTNPELNVVLTTPASRCLLLLLNASPEVVLQQTFFKQVWEDEGMLVPANTLYQNISIIRRGLRSVGETDRTLVATVPRKGFQIDKNVKITRIAAHNEAEETPDTLRGEEELDVEYTPDAAPEPAVNDVAPPVVKHAESKKMSRPLSMLLMVVAFIIGVVGVHFAWHFTDTKPFFADYTYVEEDNGCHFYTHDDGLGGTKSYEKIKALILSTGLSCKKYPWVYFPVSKTSPGLSVFVCRINYVTTTTPGCITLSFREVEIED